MSDNLIKWRVFCNTEEAWTEGWLDQGITPSKCFNSVEHEINHESYQMVEQTVKTKVEIQEETIKTGGHIKSEGFSFLIPANTTETNIISWPFPINVVNLSINSVKEEMGNVLNSIVSPITPMGVLTQDSVVGENMLSVSESVVTNVYIGLEILIDSVLVGEVLAKDTLTNSLTLTKNIEDVYLEGSLVSGQRRIVKNYNMGYKSSFTIGTGKIGASYVQANTPVLLEYINNTSLEQTLSFNVEYLY